MTAIKWLTAILLLVSCHQTKNKTYAPTQTDHSFADIWDDSNTFMYSATLRINTDSLFEFFDSGCTGKGYSKGKWKINDGDLILTSFDNYNLEIVERNLKYGIAGDEANKKKRYKGAGSLLDTPLTAQEHLLLMRDSTPLYFNSKRFRLIGDTLYGLDSMEQKTNKKFTRKM